MQKPISVCDNQSRISTYIPKFQKQIQNDTSLEYFNKPYQQNIIVNDKVDLNATRVYQNPFMQPQNYIPIFPPNQ